MALNPLLPERHPTRDFFIADIFDNLPVKDDMASMESPFFTLSTKPDRRNLTYAYGDKSVDVVPSNLGLPTIFDKDVLLYCGSHVMDQLNRGKIPPKTLRISIHDFMIATNRVTDGHAYKRFESCLIRLRGCTVTTTIRTGNTKQVKGFGLIESFEYLENERVKDRIIGLEITLSDWFYNSLIAREVLTINRDYFRLRKPIERRLYEIARKHCGTQKSWNISLDRLYAKSGSLSEIKHFRSAVRQLAKHNHLPDYRVKFDDESDSVTFSLRRGHTFEDDSEQRDLFALDSSPDESGLFIPESVPPALLDKVRNSLGNASVDYHDLWQQFRTWPKAAKAKNLDAAFLGFCKKKCSDPA